MKTTEKLYFLTILIFAFALAMYLLGLIYN